MKQTTTSWGRTTLLAVTDDYRVAKVEVFPGKRQPFHRHIHADEIIIALTNGGVLVYDESDLEDVEEGSIKVIERPCWHRIKNDADWGVEFLEIHIGDIMPDDVECRT